MVVEDLRARLEPQDQLALMVCPEQLVLKGPLVLLVALVHQELEDHRELKAQQGPQAQQARLEHLVLMGTQVQLEL